MAENAQSGSMLVSVKGGNTANTANTEYEALVRLVKEKPAGQKLFLFNVTM